MRLQINGCVPRAGHINYDHSGEETAIKVYSVPYVADGVRTSHLYDVRWMNAAKSFCVRMFRRRT